jgi:addiction module HigA family antidote
MLLKEFLEPMNLNQQQLSSAIRLPYQRINEIINGRRGITPSTALRLARFFGTSPELWLNLQLHWDLYRANKAEEPILEKIQPLHN